MFGVIGEEKGCLEKKICGFGRLMCFLVFCICEEKKVDFWSVIEERCDNWFVNWLRRFSNYIGWTNFWSKMNDEEKTEVVVELCCFRNGCWLMKRIIHRY